MAQKQTIPKSAKSVPDKTKKMEVHHHPEVEHKGFKEYVLEGLMIFLAVMMGFIAENIRESITEHTRAKDYAETMVTDLSADTVMLKDYLAYTRYALSNVDTLMQLLSASELKNIPSGKLYWYGLYGGAQAYFIPNDATFQQMKSSGSLRYFEKSVAREVAKYDQLCRQMQTMEENDRIIYAEVRKLRAQVFQFQYNNVANHITNHDPSKIDRKKVVAFINTNPPLLTYDKSIINQYIELVRSRFIERKIAAANSLLRKSTGLITDLKKEYSIDN